MLVASFSNGQTRNSCLSGQAKFAPIDGKRLLILGQDLGAVGGLDRYNSGYIDSFADLPAGITTYTSLPTLGGLYSTVNYGAGDVSAKVYADSPEFNQTSFVIGLYLVDQEKRISDGDYDEQIRKLANWIKDTNRPVYLRIGYEFDGDHNHYNSTYYKSMWRKIVDIFDEEAVANCDFVWQSDGVHSVAFMQNYYPGDEYVDWMGFSYFQKNAGGDLIRYAEIKNKPVMIAEATPRGYDLQNDNGTTAWNSWFKPLFELMDNHTIIKGLAYINTDWDSQPMWRGENWGDTRLQVNEIIKTNWDTELQGEEWIFGGNEFFENVGYPYDQITDNCFPSEDGQVTSVNDEDFRWGYVCNTEIGGLKLYLDNCKEIKSITLLEATSGKIINEIAAPQQNINNIQTSNGLYILSVEDFEGNLSRVKVMVCNHHHHHH
nr:beta-1,3-xylanase Xyl3088 [synthetic construct]